MVMRVKVVKVGTARVLCDSTGKVVYGIIRANGQLVKYNPKGVLLR